MILATNGSLRAIRSRWRRQSEKGSEVKECPVCEATTFDDMEVCYGCLHRFDGRGSGNPLSKATIGGDVLQPFDEGESGRDGDAGESGMKPPVKPGAADVASERLPKAYRLEIMLVPVDDAQAV